MTDSNTSCSNSPSIGRSPFVRQRRIYEGAVNRPVGLFYVRNETFQDPSMTTADGRFSPKTLDFLARMDATFAHMSPRAIADRVVELARTQDEWREKKCLNM